MWWRAAAGGLLVFLSLLPAPEARAEDSLPAPLAGQSLLLDATRTQTGVIAVGERGHVLQVSPTAECSDWKQLVTPTRNLLTAVTSPDGNNVLAVGHNATILRSTDGGLGWQQVFDTTQLPADDPAQGSPLLDVACSAELCVASGAYGLLLKSTDGGQSWSRFFAKEDDRNIYAVLVEDRTITLAGEAGALLQSTNGGDDWTALASPYAGSFFGLLRVAPTGLLAFGMRGNIFRSDDNGVSWSKVDSGVDASLMGGTLTAGTSVTLVGAGGTVLWSVDGGYHFAHKRLPSRVALSAPLPNDIPCAVGEAGITALGAKIAE